MRARVIRLMEKCDEDDVDYMSEDFLKELEDVRPGLLSRESKRKSKVGERSNLDLAISLHDDL